MRPYTSSCQISILRIAVRMISGSRPSSTTPIRVPGRVPRPPTTIMVNTSTICAKPKVSGFMNDW